ncbi:TetR/AcrR family transcriptional regulator [Hamadaea tsunoensis]|uniref:TetR/AcrR family transcriptional regulator n=1 Tax=Hamadaea tsunoensis TaxID=53368 RepID=UPI0004284F20|nr:TetR/AcrR family transcriptional regulator [Hamadaea tsunoensis]
MGRWEPNARTRLEQAALELYVERGYEQTTVAEIAKVAGLTERTFFRHFADKREVLFSGSHVLQDLLVGAISASPAGTPPIEVIVDAFAAAGELLEERRAFAERRQQVVSAHAELRERELLKMAALSSAAAEALRDAGTPEPHASLAAEAGVAVFRVAFERWIGNQDGPRLPDVIRETAQLLQAVVAA